MKALQKFSDEYLENCKNLSPIEILEFIENFRELHSNIPTKSKLISIKIPENLLSAFKRKADLANQPYQSKIKELMREWLLK